MPIEEAVAASESARLDERLESWSGAALRHGWVDAWVEGAILTTEMTFFLARCETLGVRRVIESGRQDGFSTRILGQWARETGGEVVSIDLELDAERARRCCERLAAWPEVRLLKGDANLLLEAEAARSSTLTALLVDGPKGFWAMSLLFAAARHEWVRLIALHNLGPGGRARRLFESLAASPAFHEGWPAPDHPEWERLREREQKACLAPLARAGEPSTLGVMEVIPAVRRRLGSVWDRGFRLFQPAVVRWGWSRGWLRSTRWLFELSLRLIG